MNFIPYYIDQYQKAHPRNLPAFASDIKERAMEWLADATFPSAKDENYLYTRVAPIFEQKLALHRKPKTVYGQDMPCLYETRNPNGEALNEVNPETIDILIHNGYHLPDNPIRQFPGGIIVGSFAGMIKQFEHIYLNFYRNYKLSDDVLVNLNTMLSGDGFFLFVPAGARPDKPVQITNLFDACNDALIQPRNLIIMEAGSSAELMVIDHTPSGKSCVCNDVTEVALGEAATLEMVRLQQVNDSTRLFTHTSVQQAASSRMKTHYMTLGGGTVRNNLRVTLADTKAEHFAGGLSLTQQNEHIDNNILIEHASPDCQSNQLLKHILSGKSTGAFTGRIIVDKDARKTLAYQKSSNVLLHSEAKMNIRPQLEIDADDVKCSHGATVGQLNTEALFYLRSRGIDEAGAKRILLHAFAGETIHHISCEPFRKSILKLTEKKLEKMSN